MERSQLRHSTAAIVVRLNDNCGEEVACRPRKFRNIDWGYHKYLSHVELKQRYLTGIGDSVSILVAAVKLFHA